MAKFAYETDFESQFKLAYAKAQTGPLGPRLQTFVEQIGFYWSGAIASALCALLVIAFEVADKDHLPALFWSPIFLACSVTLGYRFRRFWTYLGDYVVRDVLGS